jgi:rhodanese-related sulfurtransferase
MSRKRESVLLQSAGILFVSLFLGLTYNAISPKGIPILRSTPATIPLPDSLLFGPDDPKKEHSDTTASSPKVAVKPVKVDSSARKAPSTAPKVVPEKSADGMFVITIAQFERILARKQALVLDARNPDEFERGHITGARNIPFTRIEEHFEELLEIPRDTMIVVYCSDPDCPLGRELVRFMEQMDFKELLLFDAGWDGWVAAGKGGEVR